MTRSVPPSTILSVVTLVVANLLPLAGVLFFGWSVFEVLVLFWAENVVIGAYDVLRMLVVLALRREGAMVALIPFFIVHYGLFCAGHAIFLVAGFAPGLATGDLSRTLPAALTAGSFVIPLLALVASHGISFLANFLWGGEWRRVDGKALMGAPYPRIVVMHVTIIVGTMLVVAAGSPVAAVAFLVALKIGVDLAAHLREHRRLAAPAEAAPPQGALP